MYQETELSAAPSHLRRAHCKCNARSQARIKIHRQGQIVLVLEMIGNDVHVFREDQDAHVGHILQL